MYLHNIAIQIERGLSSLSAVHPSQLIIRSSFQKNRRVKEHQTVGTNEDLLEKDLRNHPPLIASPPKVMSPPSRRPFRGFFTMSHQRDATGGEKGGDERGRNRSSESPDKCGSGSGEAHDGNRTTKRSDSSYGRGGFWRRNKYCRESPTTDVRLRSPEDKSARLVAEDFVSDIFRSCSSSVSETRDGSDR